MDRFRRNKKTPGLSSLSKTTKSEKQKKFKKTLKFSKQKNSTDTGETKMLCMHIVLLPVLYYIYKCTKLTVIIYYTLDFLIIQSHKQLSGPLDEGRRESDNSCILIQSALTGFRPLL